MDNLKTSGLKITGWKSPCTAVLREVVLYYICPYSVIVCGMCTLHTNNERFEMQKSIESSVTPVVNSNAFS